MKTMRFLLAENKSILHYPTKKVLEYYEGVDFNHVAILDHFDFVTEAVYPRVRQIPLYYWKKQFKIVRIYEKEMTDEEYHQFMVIVDKMINKPYSILQIWMIYIAQTFVTLKNYIFNTGWDGWRAMICSEVLARPIKVVFKYDFGQDLDTVGLDEIEAALITLSKKRD